MWNGHLIKKIEFGISSHQYSNKNHHIDSCWVKPSDNHKQQCKSIFETTEFFSVGIEPF
jgi:hypothetical protein